MRKARFAMVAVLGWALAAQVAGAAEKKETPDASIRLSSGSVAAGIGFSWGSGVLTYKGKQYPITVDGISVGDIGVSKASASGHVYHLKNLSDFDGNYTAASAGATVGGGGSASVMQNQHGVVVKLLSTTRGLKLKLAAEGVKMALKKK